MTVAGLARELRDLPIGLINPPALAARQRMDPEALEELARDIRSQGVTTPLWVSRDGERFEIIAGHRRYCAAERAGLVVVPCLVYESPAAALERLKFSENYHREPLNPADEALYFAQLLERDFGGDTDRLSAAFNISRAYAEQRLNLLTYGEEIFLALQNGEIGVGVAQQLGRFRDPVMRRGMLKQAIQGGATVAVVSAWLADYQRSLGPLGEQPTILSSAPAPGASVIDDVFVCVCCGERTNVHLMRQINVHDYCRLAILDKLLASYRGESANG